MERKFSILGLLVIIPYMEFCFLKVGKIDMFSKTLAGKLKYPFNFLNKFNMIKCDQFSKATVILFKVNLKRLYLSFHLRAAVSKYQTSPDSSKKSTSILFHKKNPYIELFSKMEFKRFSEFHFSRNREMSAFARLGLGANPKIGQFWEC